MNKIHSGANTYSYTYIGGSDLHVALAYMNAAVLQHCECLMLFSQQEDPGFNSCIVRAFVWSLQLLSPCLGEVFLSALVYPLNPKHA